MATFYSQSAKDPNALRGPSALYVSAPQRAMVGITSLAAGAAINDQVIVGAISSSAILLPSSSLAHDALGAGVTLNVGFDDGGAGKATALGSALAVATAGTKSGVAAVSVANLTKKVWEIAGFTSDPKKELNIVYTIAGAAVGSAGKIAHNFQFVSGT